VNQDLTDMMKVVKGDQKALGAIYDRYGSMVFGIAMRVLRDENRAQEVTQDVFLAAWQKGHKYDPTRGSLSTWLGLMAHSKAIDLLRKMPIEEIATESLPEIKAEISANEPEEKVLADVETIRLKKALEQLTPLQKECLELMYFRGLKQAEIAKQLNVPLGTIKARIFHSLGALRAILEEVDDE
jgi:RNA polymerase sigma-70 factor (ECF subfamily)